MCRRSRDSNTYFRFVLRPSNVSSTNYNNSYTNVGPERILWRSRFCHDDRSFLLPKWQFVIQIYFFYIVDQPMAYDVAGLVFSCFFFKLITLVFSPKKFYLLRAISVFWFKPCDTLVILELISFSYWDTIYTENRLEWNDFNEIYAKEHKRES